MNISKDIPCPGLTKALCTVADVLVEDIKERDN